MNNKFATQLSKLIKNMGLSKAEFAKKINMSVISVSDWIDGKALPRAKSIRTICKTFNVSSDYLLGLKDEP